jgi:hypothetical protein
MTRAAMMMAKASFEGLRVDCGVIASRADEVRGDI